MVEYTFRRFGASLGAGKMPVASAGGGGGTYEGALPLSSYRTVVEFCKDRTGNTPATHARTTCERVAGKWGGDRRGRGTDQQCLRVGRR